MLALPQRRNTASGLRGGGLLVACSFTFEVGGPSSSPPPPWSLTTAPQSWLCPSRANKVGNLSVVLDNAESGVPAYRIASNGQVLDASHWFAVPTGLLPVGLLHLHLLVPLEQLQEGLSFHLQMLQVRPVVQVHCTLSSASVLVVLHQTVLQDIATYLQVVRCSGSTLCVTSSPLASALVAPLPS